MACEGKMLTIQSFHKCTSLISIKLSITNYLLWCSQVVLLLRSLGIKQHLHSNDKLEAERKDLYSTQLNNDRLLTSRILGIISEEVFGMIEGLNTGHQVWKSLEETLLTITKENEIHLNESLHCLKKGNMSLDDYIKKFKFLCDKLTAIKKPMNDVSKVFTSARGLGPNYKDFRTAMLSKAPYPTFN